MWNLDVLQSRIFSFWTFTDKKEYAKLKYEVKFIIQIIECNLYYFKLGTERQCLRNHNLRSEILLTGLFQNTAVTKTALGLFRVWYIVVSTKILSQDCKNDYVDKKKPYMVLGTHIK